MTNQEIAQTLEQLADLLEFQGADAFRLRAYRSAARAIELAPEPLADWVADGKPLTEIDGIGKSVAEKCVELLRTGRLTQLDQLLQVVPRSVLDLLRVPKLGPKKAAVLYRELQIVDLDSLRAACEAGQVRGLAGFGEKTEAAILKGIEIAAAGKTRLYWADAEPLALELCEYLRRAAAIEQVELAGSFRRGQDTVGDLDLLLASGDSPAALQHAAAFPRIEQVVEQTSGELIARLANGLRIELRVVAAEDWSGALLYHTGSRYHHEGLEPRLAEHGWRLTPQGIRDSSGQRPVDARPTEADWYAALGLAWIPPELREGRDELLLAARRELPRLIERGDLRGDLHMHTTATDGSASIAEMAAAARTRGLQYIAITDHSKRVAMANGLTAERAVAQWDEIDRINAAGDGTFWIFKGIECDILEDATLDLPDPILARADWVLASVHYGQEQSRGQITDRILTAVRNPHVKAIAHPTGRILNRRKPYAVDIEAVFQAAVEFDKILELNANPARLDLHDEHCAAARARGIPLVINSDAHTPQGIDVLRFGVLQARRGGLSPGDVVNSLPLEQLKRRLEPK